MGEHGNVARRRSTEDFKAFLADTADFTDWMDVALMSEAVEVKAS